MNLEMIGINHETSDIAARDQAAIGVNRLPEAYQMINKIPGIEGVIIISTCNRVEIYTSPDKHLPEAEFRGLFGQVTGLPEEEVEKAYIFKNEETVRHLYRVASGLDSQLVGEIQILRQVKDAYFAALDLGSASGVLNRLFLSAIECGKLVRERTAISRGAVSVSLAAVNLAKKIFGDLQKKNVLIVGAGETSKLTAMHFMKAGVESWRISNRTRKNAEALAHKISGDVIDFPPNNQDLDWADVIVSATGAADLIVRAEDLQDIIDKRHDPMCFLDLAVPRDIDPKLKDVENVFVYSVDDFTELVESNLKARRKEVIRADKFVNQSVDRFVKWYRENRVAPTIQQLQEIIEGIRLSEIEKNAKRFCEKDQENIDKFSKTLVKKIIGLIIANMKRASVDRDDLSLAKAVLMAFSQKDREELKKVMEKLDHELSH
jgi:glutamyl-tRNA reductase